MSMQHQWVRRNASPTGIRGPMKAVHHFTLKSSPTRRSPSSPTCNFPHRSSPDTTYRTSPERRSPISPSFKVIEKPKPVKPHQTLRRAGSLEAIYGQTNAYLKGQWPIQSQSPEIHNDCMVDKSTQTLTSEELENAVQQSQNKSKKKKKNHRRSASFGQGDQLKIFRQKLQKIQIRQQNDSCKQPVSANHLALNSTAPAALQSVAKVQKPINIPSSISRNSQMSKFQRNSVEGLNLELENLALSHPQTNGDSDVFEDGNEKGQADLMDGRRAPVHDLLCRSSTTRSVDTQTPKDPDCINDNTGYNSRPHSISPAIHFHLETSRPPSSSDIASDSHRDVDKGNKADSPDMPCKVVCSPGPNKSKAFVREPPDGCERVKVIDENSSPASHPSLKPALLIKPPTKTFNLKPGENSAFQTLKKMYDTNLQATGAT